VGEAAFDDFTAAALQGFAVIARAAITVVIDSSFLRVGLVGPFAFVLR